MKVFLIIFLTFLYVVCSSALQYRSVEAYYWRDFNGLLPFNAIKGGKDENGEDTYIGQFTTVAEYNTGKARLHTLPAVIKKGSLHAFAPYMGRVLRSNATTSTKVLCYDRETSYKWYSPTSSFPSSCRYVVGGNEDGYPMFIGRANHNKEMVVGKIFSDNTNHRPGLISAYNGVEVHHSTYQVLTHCP